METRLCRVCWNENDWWCPDGSAKESNSYHHDNGFGHEEWLFRYDWMLSGYDNSGESYRYGYLQPIGKLNDSYKAKRMRIILYSLIDNSYFAVIGIINNALIIDNNEAMWVASKMLKLGWLAEMRNELKLINANINAIPDQKWNPRNSQIEPLHVINIRFMPSDVVKVSPVFPLEKYYESRRITRYIPYINNTSSVISGIESLSARENGISDFDKTQTDDLRKRALSQIALRSGQGTFRVALLEAYGQRCAVTGCDVPAVLEAAHIMPYRNPAMNHVQNGLLLRADIHNLFDLGLLTIDPTDYRVVLDKSLEGTSVWDKPWVGKQISLPSEKNKWPNVEALKTRNRK